jgi:hypothetical protein
MSDAERIEQLEKAIDTFLNTSDIGDDHEAGLIKALDRLALESGYFDRKAA